MIHDLALRWVVTMLFGLSAAECLWSIAGHRRWTGVVGHVLHVVMAVAMAVMAWPKGAELPTTGPMVFFLLAAAWFAVISLTRAGAGHRVVNTYHILMMLAMAWMYAVMNGHLLPGQSSEHHSTTMPGMNMPGTDGSTGDGYPAWINALNWVCTIGFAVAAAFWIYRYFAVRKRNSTEYTSRHLGVICQAMMAAGMAIMFGVML